MGAPAWVAEIGVIATFLVATIALFGERFRLWMFPPRLHIELAHEEGDLEIERLTWAEAGGPKERSRDARYYRLRVSNERRTSPVRDVQIFVEAIETYGPDGQRVLEYRGPIPLEWQHSETFPRARTIGSSAVADFVAVSEDRTLQLRTTTFPNVYAMAYSGHAKLRITVAARGLEADSQPVPFIVAWDGQWDRGRAEMKKHLTIRIDSD